MLLNVSTRLPGGGLRVFSTFTDACPPWTTNAYGNEANSGAAPRVLGSHRRPAHSVLVSNRAVWIAIQPAYDLFR